jgi:hypothetical protein
MLMSTDRICVSEKDELNEQAIVEIAIPRRRLCYEDY